MKLIFQILNELLKRQFATHTVRVKYLNSRGVVLGSKTYYTWTEASAKRLTLWIRDNAP